MERRQVGPTHRQVAVVGQGTWASQTVGERKGGWKMCMTVWQPRQHEPHVEVPYVTSTTLDRLLRDASMPVLVSFQTFRSEVLVHALEMVSKAFDGALHVLRVNVLTNLDLVARFSIRVVPTLLFFKMGVPTEFIVGTVPLRFILHMACKVVGVRQKGSVRKARASLGAFPLQSLGLGNPIDTPDARMLWRCRT
jgi:thioredoxin-like negative regulator of GroEL